MYERSEVNNSLLRWAPDTMCPSQNAGSVAQAKKTDAASPDDEQEEQDEPTSEGDERALLRKVRLNTVLVVPPLPSS
jgi:hypothetical protein